MQMADMSLSWRANCAGAGQPGLDLSAAPVTVAADRMALSKSGQTDAERSCGAV